MRKQIRKRACAAGIALACAGAPFARGDFAITIFNMGQQTYGGNAWDVFVLAATNDGTNNTGSTLAAADVIIDTGDPTTFNSQTNALGIDIEGLSGIGSNAKYNTNINGTVFQTFGQNSINNQNNAAPPEFGDIVGGTMVGVGTGTFTTDLVNNPVITQDGAQGTGSGSKGGTASVYVNGQTSDYLASGNVGANFLNDFLNPPKTPLLDQGFENGLQSTNTLNHASVNTGNHAGALLNGTVHSLEVDTVSEDNSGNVIYVPDDTTNNGSVPAGQGGNVPFANIVVPAGISAFVVHGQLAGESGGSRAFTQVFGEPPPPTFIINLTSTANNGSNVGTVTIVGTNGGYTPGTASPAGAQQVTGNLTIQNGAGGDFTIALNHNQIIGLDVSGEASLSQLVSDLQNALQATNPGVTVSTPTIPFLIANGDNLQLTFPGGSSVPGTNPEFLSYTGDGSITVSQITVVPEPASVALLAFGGSLLVRRKPRTKRDRNRIE